MSKGQRPSFDQIWEVHWKRYTPVPLSVIFSGTDCVGRWGKWGETVEHMWVKKMKEPSRGKACLGCGDKYKHDLLRVRLIWSENRSSEVAVRCLSQGWIFIHWSSLPLRLPSSLVENPKMEWDLILNGQICQTQEQSLSLLRWFCLRYGVSGVDSKC